MTRSRELAKILTDGNLTGTLDVTGAFTSQGIDDNADATAITIDSNEDITITKQGTNTTDLRFANSTNSFGGNIKYDHNSGRMMIHTHNAERVRIDASGNVGIGETSPLGKLHIKSGDSGASSVSVNANELVIENSDYTGITILGENESNIMFGDNEDPDVGRIEYHHSDNSMRFRANASDRMRIDSSGITVTGNITNTSGNFLSTSAANSYIIVNGNENAVAAVANGAVSLYHDNVEKLTTTSYGTYTTGQMRTNTGVGFGAAAANLLNDYEEGTWTPTLVSSGATFQYSVRSAVYTKVGDTVHFNMYVQLDGGGNSFNSNIVTLSGFPFTSRNSTGALSRHFIHGRYLNVSGSSYTYAFLGLNNNSSVANLVEGGDNVPLANLNSNNLSASSGQIVCSGIYFTDS